MSNYETDPAGLGVGQVYGPIKTGGSVGSTRSTDAEFQFVFEVAGTELASSAAKKIKLTDGYALVDKVYVEVNEAFTANDAMDILYDGSTILDAAVVVDALGIVEGDTTIIGNTVIDATKELSVDISGVTAGVGKAKVVVNARRV